MKNKKGRIAGIIIGSIVTIGGTWSLITEESSLVSYFALVIPISGILLLMFYKR